MTQEQQNKRDMEYLAKPDPEAIYLGPKCQGLDYEGRQWSTDALDCPEDECGLKAVKYIRADLALNSNLTDSAWAALSWLDRWAMHVGKCPADENCTCGLVAIRHELGLALTPADNED